VKIGKKPKKKKKKKKHFISTMPRNKCRNVKVTEANRRRGPGTTEKVSSGRINLESNTYVQESNVSKLPV
jgi:hypothetical protein